MPTILRIGSYRFYFYSHEPNEPPHVHIDKGELSVKIWIENAVVAKNLGFHVAELKKLQKLVVEHRQLFLGKWYEYFGA